MQFARVMVAFAMVGCAFGQAAPKADDLLKTARFVATLQHQDLQGSIRKDARGQQKIPVSLFLRGENIQFGYTNPKTRKETRFHMRLKNDRFDLFEVAPNGKTVRFPDAKLGQPIENTDLSYEDLSMRFLYWPNGQVMGVEKIRGQECWKVWLQNPGKGGRYGFVYVWVHLKSGALMQVVGYDRTKRPLKRFKITEIMRVGDTFTLRQMRVDSIDPAKNEVRGITYLEFDKPKKAAPGGLR